MRRQRYLAPEHTGALRSQAASLRAADQDGPNLRAVTAADARAQRCSADTVTRVERAAGALATRALAQMDTSLPWFATMRPEVRATCGLIAQSGIALFARWLRHPRNDAEAAAEFFAKVPPETPRVLTLQQAVKLIRTVVDVVETTVDELAAPGEAERLQESVIRFSRELAFAAASVYAQAAEQRGAWDARLEALLVDAILRGDQDDSLLSRAAALGWTAREQVVVVVGWTPPGLPRTVLHNVQDTARQARLGILASVQGNRLITVLGDCADPMAAATTLLPAYGDDTVVVGPAVGGLMQAYRSAAAALAGLRAAPVWPNAPRPVAADDLLPERALDGDPLARQTLLDQVYLPLLTAGEGVVSTVSTYLETAHSVEATARQLFIHPNTVRYRLRRAGEACGRMATDPRDAQVLLIALAIGRLADRRLPS